MKAVQVMGDALSPHISCNNDLPQPTPRAAEMLIQVHAAGITGDEVTWPELYRTPSRIPGHEISGVIASTGPDYVGPLKVGQEVAAFLTAERGEGQAEYALCSADEVTSKPTSISHAEAAALPIPLLTAWEAITDHAKITSGMKVLVTGASGAVGSIFTQLAAHLTGAEVIALASRQNHESLKRLGAHSVLDYNTEDWEKAATGVDVIFDTVGGDILAKTWEAISDSGTIITVADPPPPWAFGKGPAAESVGRPGVKYIYFVVSPNSERLRKALEFIDTGVVKALNIKTFPFEEASQAWSHAQGRNRGYKAVIDLKGAEKS
ncbi:hypothetical protein JX266_007136 [Neoarthrinium moseri]|uniref:uncharacterized protein n=1 Tax=Neoarthrinium moseri TaxID=1658444 RepID=UPI001FDB9416|nr:uncharacterized protein JN550_003612 [Neoarthrinium moseri]KAI1846915.1 hypothetical protein JX266_007136 [Neoarthrinium moseri]KAI1872738.1 hypothetical protein JN550_003612 [Neoarthrinium moseri]